MAGKASLPLAVEIAFGSGPMDLSPTWTDVSAHVQRSKTIATSRGWDTETGEPVAGRGQLRLRNKTGDFTPGRTGAYGLIRNKLPIRTRQAGVTLWTGVIETWSMGYDGLLPVVDVTCVDRWARMKARKLEGDRIQRACQALAPENLWPLTDPAGSTRAANLVADWSLLPIGEGTVGWGLATNPHTPADGQLPAVQFPAPPIVGLSSGVGPSSYTAGLTVAAWVRSPTAGASTAIQVDDPYGIAVFVNQTVVQLTSSPLVIIAEVALPASSTWRHIAVTAALSGDDVTVALHVDGSRVFLQTVTHPDWTPERLHYISGADGSQAAYAATWDRPLTSMEVHSLWAAGVNALGEAGQAADTRADLVGAMWATTSITASGTFTATMSKQAVAEVSQADLLLACARAEGGTLHISPDGWPVLRAAADRTSGPLAATIPAAVLARDAQWQLDDQQLCNVATVERMALDEVAATVTRRNQASVDAYDEASKTLQLWLDSDSQAAARADAEANMWATPLPRSRSFTVDLMTCQESIAAATLLAVDIGSRITISGLPTQTPDSSAAGWWVDQIADDITESSWRRTFTVTPAIDFLIWDDPVFGVLDAYPLAP